MPEFSNNYGNPFESGSDRTREFDRQDIEQNKVIAGLSYLWILFFLPLVCCPNSRFGRFHANQALVLFIGESILGAAGWMFGWIPIIGWIIQTACSILIAVLIIMGMVQAFMGKARELPIVGKIYIIK